MKEGWICPRCGKVNAPFMPSCDCTSSYHSTADPLNFLCAHNWEVKYNNNMEPYYQCRYCGKIQTNWAIGSIDGKTLDY